MPAEAIKNQAGSWDLMEGVNDRDWWLGDRQLIAPKTEWRVADRGWLAAPVGGVKSIFNLLVRAAFFPSPHNKVFGLMPI